MKGSSFGDGSVKGVGGPMDLDEGEGLDGRALKALALLFEGILSLPNNVRVTIYEQRSRAAWKSAALLVYLCRRNISIRSPEFRLL